MAQKANNSKSVLNLREFAEKIGVSYITAKRRWPQWIDLGIVPSRYPTRTLRFKASDADRFMQLTKVTQ